MDMLKIIQKAKKNRLYLWLLNTGLARMIPFNKPHKFRIVELGDYHIKTKVPYRKYNFNHIGGIHACALATLSEFCTGFMLLSLLDVRKYRIIMQSLHMEYHYQAKMDCYAHFQLTDAWLRAQVLEPLASGDKVTVNCEVLIHDLADNHISTGIVQWQIKSWQQVKTKL
ncbi:MAG: DUF4442 domain-containing protein [Cyclobacteriaceae bacterium]|nr:DUF4442 domain-containing protein [Cyclobacteriaceae bacterium]